MPDKRFDRIHEFIAPLKVKPGSKVRLPKDFDPRYSGDFVRKEEASELLGQGTQWLSEFQMRLAAQDTWSLLVIFQAMDAAGKDGTIRHVMSGVNPQGVEVTSFKVPSELERDHDYLWRAALRLPARGMIGIFNRSYYEETLVVRVHPSILAAQKMPQASKGKDVWERRFREINDWERYLTDNGTKIVKLFLNVSRDEQKERFLARIDEPESNWFMRVASAAVILDALMEIDPKFPVPTPEARADMLKAKEELLAEGGHPTPAAPAAEPSQPATGPKENA